MAFENVEKTAQLRKMGMIVETTDPIIINPHDMASNNHGLATAKIWFFLVTQFAPLGHPVGQLDQTSILFQLKLQE